jgi:hypothetical protein
MRELTKASLVLILAAGGCGVSDNPEYCEDHAGCALNPAGSFCHPTKHYCYAGCSSDQECQDPGSRAFVSADQPLCELATRLCRPRAPRPDAGRALDAGPTPDSRPSGDQGVAPTPDSSRKPRGASCSAAAECESGFCADGVCCDGACDGTCVACNLAGSAGTCVPVSAGEDPAKECVGKGTCTGSCDGKGACSFAATAGKSCASPVCTAATLTSSRCDAKGACVASTAPCGGYACVGASACKTSCTTSSDCTTGFACIAGKCTAQLSLGAACGQNDEACASKHCTDGACCKTASCGACRACGAGGECLPANEGGSCGAPACAGNAASGATQTVPLCKAGACASTSKPCGDYLCDAAGGSCLAACASDAQCKASAYCAGAKCLPKKPLGQACSAAKECQSASCVDGVCCDGACGGTCMSCKLPGSIGLCKPIASGANPDGECKGTDPACSGTCDGKGACAYPGLTTSCRPTVCDGYMLRNGSCYQGDCHLHGEGCAGDYLCATATTCGTSCTSGAQCMTGHCDLTDLFGRKNTCATLDEVCHADAKACPAKGAGSKASPFCAIQDCLDTKRPYVLVAEGTYSENLVVKAKVQLLAPFAGSLVDPRTGAVSSSALKVELVPPQDIAGVSAINVGKVLLRGLRVTRHGASSNGPLVVVENPGGPMELRLESCELWEAKGSNHRALDAAGTKAGLKLSVHDSALTGSPGGLRVTGYASAAALSLQKVVLAGNAGDGLTATNATVTLSDVLVAWNGGAGVNASASSLTIDRAKIGVNGGVGIDLAGANARVTNTLVNDNVGGGVRLAGSGTLLGGLNLELVNVTLANNKSAELACPSWTSGTGQVVVENSIIYGPANPIVNVLACPVEVHHSNVKNMGTATNISTDPLFVGGASDPYRLQPTSPCVDGGLDAEVLGSLDVNGQPRLVGKKSGANKVDLGAFELQ